MFACNRMRDVKNLRNHICQDYIRHLLPNDWQKLVYQKAEKEITNNMPHKNHYLPAYERMRDFGIDNYQVEDMDVTIIAELLHGCRNFINASPKVISAIDIVRNDRNFDDHSGGSEGLDELYLEGLMILCDLRYFVRIVDRFERNISDITRLLYRQQYITEIETLKNALDAERIEIIQKVKNMDSDIQKILHSETPCDTWNIVKNAYRDRYWVLGKDPDNYCDFLIRASDAGVIYAHEGAAEYFGIIRKDYEETERRLFMVYNAFVNENGSEGKMKAIIDLINDCLDAGCPLRDGFKELIENVRKQGNDITQLENGRYLWTSKNKKTLRVIGETNIDLLPAH